MLFLLISFVGFTSAKAQMQNRLLQFGDLDFETPCALNFDTIVNGSTDKEMLGILKESKETNSFEILKLEKGTETFIKERFHQENAKQKVILVIEEVKLDEEPYGAIEVAKASLTGKAYLKIGDKFKLVYKGTVGNSLSALDVSTKLDSFMATTIIKFLAECCQHISDPASGEAQLFSKDVILSTLSFAKSATAPMGIMSYDGAFHLSGKKITTAEAKQIFEKTGNEEVISLFEKGKSRQAWGISLATIGSGAISFAVATAIISGPELNGLLIIGGSAGIIGSLFMVRGGKKKLQEACKLYNQMHRLE